MSVDLATVLKPAITDMVTTQTANLESRITAVEASLSSAAIAAAPAVIADVTAAGGAVLVNLEKDPVTQRVVVWSIVGALLGAAVVVLVCALLGNTTANRWIVSAPAAVIAAALWVSNSGATATHKVVPVNPTATITVGKMLPADLTTGPLPV